MKTNAKHSFQQVMETIKHEVFDEILDVQGIFRITIPQHQEYLRIVKTGKPKMVAMSEALSNFPNNYLEQRVLLSLYNEELGLCFNFWATRGEDREIGRLMSEGLPQREAMKKVLPPKRKKPMIEK